MIDTIRKETPHEEVLEILRKRDFSTPFIGEFVFNGLLQDCDYIRIVGYGQQLKFRLVNEEQEGKRRE